VKLRLVDLANNYRIRLTDLGAGRRQWRGTTVEVAHTGRNVMEDRVVDLRDTDEGTETRTAAVVTAERPDLEALQSRLSTLEDENAALRLQLAVFAATDPATGLANRIGLLDAIEMACYRLARMAEPFAVVVTSFGQLDGIDDPEEHLEAVRDLGAMLAAGLRNVDRVGRIGASSFVSVLANIPFEHIDTVVSRTRASLRAMSTAADVAADTIDARVIALSVTDSDSVLDADTILRHCAALMEDPNSAETQSYSG